MSTHPPTTCRSMPCFTIQAIRAGISDSGLEIGRVGLPPANDKAMLPSASICRTEGKRALSARMAVKSCGGTMCAWQSTIMVRPSLRSRLLDRFAKFSDLERKRIHGNAQGTQRVIHGIGDCGGRAEIAGLA